MTFSRRARRAARLLVAACLTGVAVAPRAEAQRADSTRAAPSARPSRGAGADTIIPRPPISPRRAFLYSLALPGLGQAALDRPTAGALFAGIEMVAFGMVQKSAYDLRVAKRFRRDSVVTSYDTSATGAPVPATFSDSSRLGARVRARRVHLEDWMAVILFNHLFAGADAFVAAQLWDLPTQVSVRPRDGGGAVVAASIAW